jgi:hypothetical protein
MAGVGRCGPDPGRADPGRAGGRAGLVRAALPATAIMALADVAVAMLFLGVNCPLMAPMLLRAWGVPQAIGRGVGASGRVCLAGSLARPLAPDAPALVQPARPLPPVAETALCLWLIVRARV